MAQLYFRYSTMGAGKSLDILKIAYNYTEQNKKVLLLTSELDDRYGVGKITSRAGLQQEATPIGPNSDILGIIKSVNPLCVLIDEAQFLSKRHVLELCKVVDDLNIPVIAYGLKNDFRNELFEGSKYLLLYADKLEEVKTICWYCNRKATMILKSKDGKPVYEGKQIEIGGNDKYMPVCRKHYYDPIKSTGTQL